MSSNAMISTINRGREIVIGRIEALDESLFDVQPPQFNNTIRWNIGHVIVILDSLVIRRVTGSSKLTDNFIAMFKGGTRPSEWTTTPPSKAELVDLMKQQVNDINALIADKVDDTLAEPVQIRYFKLGTVGDVLGFAIMHESMHSAMIADMARIIKYQNS